MTFGWYGISLDLPDDWAPAAITGQRNEGYVRLASTGKVGIQIRWRSAKHAGHLPDRLPTYFDRLAKDAKKAKVPFESEIFEDGDRVLYRYKGALNGRGVLLYHAASKRIVFLESVSSSTASLEGPMRDALRSLRLDEDGLETWAALGLKVRLPEGLMVERRTFMSGRIALDLATRGAKIRAERWGFGEQLIQKHGLADWSRNALQMAKAEVEELECGVKLTLKRPLVPPIFGIAAFDTENNQIQTVRSISRQEKWRPEWRWIS